MTSERALACLNAGLSILAASVDAEGVPSCCRGIAIRSNDQLETLTLYVPVATSQQMLANVASTRRIAVVASDVVSHHTTQIKGTTTNVRLASEEERAFVRGRLQDYSDVLETVGLPKRITRTVNHWPAFAIEFDVREVFDQTPGPKAGSAIT